MAEEKAVRLGKVAKEFNVGLQHVVEYLAAKGITVDSSPNAKLNADVYVLLQEKYQPDKLAKQDAQELTREKHSRDNLVIEAKVSKSHAQKSEFENDTDDSLKQSLNELKLSAAEKKTVRKKEKEPEPTPLPTLVEPATPDKPAITVFSPTSTLCAICTKLSNLTPLRNMVEPNVALSIEQFEPISILSSITTFPI